MSSVKIATHQLNSAFWVPMTASEDDFHKLFGVGIVQVFVLSEKFAQLCKSSFSNFRRLAKLHPCCLQQFWGLHTCVDIKLSRHFFFFFLFFTPQAFLSTWTWHDDVSMRTDVLSICSLTYYTPRSHTTAPAISRWEKETKHEKVQNSPSRADNRWLSWCPLKYLLIIFFKLSTQIFSLRSQNAAIWVCWVAYKERTATRITNRINAIEKMRKTKNFKRNFFFIALSCPSSWTVCTISMSQCRVQRVDNDSIVSNPMHASD